MIVAYNELFSKTSAKLVNVLQTFTIFTRNYSLYIK